MTFLLLGLCVSLLAFGTVIVLATLVLTPVFRRAGAGLWSSDGLFALRLAPTVCALLAVAGLLLPAWLTHEPRHGGERVTWLMVAAAAGTMGLVCAGALRAGRSLHAARRLRRRLSEGAEAIDLPGAPAPAFVIDHEFPLVALVGIVRPRLYVSRQVLGLCTPDELAAILGHETGHFVRRDNLRQLLVRSCPDPLAWTAAGARLEAAWEEACDRSADDHGARGGRRDDLASALVKVARAVRAPLPAAALSFAFSRSDAVAVRVRRLLDGPARDGRRIGRAGVPLLLAGIAAASLVSGWDAALLEVHGMTESVVRFLQ